MGRAKNSKDGASQASIARASMDVLAEKYMTSYAYAVLEDRSIPSIEDGLKPVQRRLLWAMHNLSLKHTGAYMKSARIVGETMGRLHPHGDASIYSALVRLASGIPDPLVDGYGNWGGHAFDAAAARYTECRFSATGYLTYFDPFYLRAVETVPNYDGSTKEPVVLPAIYPMVLTIGQSGIAVGTTTSIPAFTFDSVKKVVRHILANSTGNVCRRATAKLLAKHLEFSTTYGGTVTSSLEEITELMNTGVGAIKWKCDYTVDASKGIITMTGFPPEWAFESRTRKIAELPYVASAVDQSDKDGVKFVVVLKRSSDDERSTNIDKILSMMTCTITYRVNFNSRTLNDKTEPHEVKTIFSSKSIVELLNDWMDWRLNYLEKRALNAELQVLNERLDKQQLRMIAINGIDVIFDLLKARNIDKVAALSKRLKITTEQAKEIWLIAVGQLDKLSFEETQKTIKSIKASISQVQKDLKQLPQSALRHMT